MQYLVSADKIRNNVDRIYSEDGDERFYVLYSGSNGQFLMRVYDWADQLVGKVTIRDQKFEIEAEGKYCGYYQKPLFKQQYINDFNDWHTDGNIRSGTFAIGSSTEGYIGGIEKGRNGKEYTIDVESEENTVLIISIVLAINNL